MKQILTHIPQDLINFSIVFLFSLIIGIEQRMHHTEAKEDILFGTGRTFALIGILGFVLYIISPHNFLIYGLGALILALFLSIYYFQKIKKAKHYGLTSVVIALLTYSLAPLLYTEPKWLVLLIFVSILILTEIKEELFALSQKFGNDEFLTLAKFIFISGIILPLLPQTPIIQGIKLTPYQLWMAIVAVSAISYFSYLLQKFVFPDSGIMLTAIIGGLYSSTATTIILARKSKSEANNLIMVAAILSATAMMYLRLLLLALIFNKDIALSLLPYLSVMIIVTAAISFFLARNKKTENSPTKEKHHNNPLELKTALIFGLLFAFFSVLTGFIVKNYGNAGINILSLIVGVTDIDPFILNLFQNGSQTLGIPLIVKATLIATSSNNLLKMIYSISLGSRNLRKATILTFSILIIIGLLLTIL